jgi:hypothetical protein
MKLKFAAALCALSISGAANAAGLTGVQVDGTMTISNFPENYFDPGYGSVPAGYGNSTSANGVTIGNGTEFGYADGANTDTVDFTDTQLILTDVSNGGSAPISFSFTSLTPGAFGGLSLVSSNFSEPLFYSLVGDTITVGWSEDYFTRGTQTFTAVFNVTPGAGGVPEPGTWAMMLLGFGAMGAALRRNRRERDVAAAAAA